MEWLNYHHLLYFWVTAREGGISRAAAKLHVSHPTISGQIHELEQALGEKLFTRVGRGLQLTEMGQVVRRYADEIFSLGQEMLDAVRDRPTGRALRVTVGVADAVPKLVVRRLLEPLRALPEPVRIVCREDKPERLLAELSLHAFDVVIADAPVGAGASVRAFSHLLGECGTTLFAAGRQAPRWRKGFPQSLHDAPLLLPTENTALRRALDAWFEAQDIRPKITGEFEDSALLKVFGQDGLGVFPGPTAIEAQIRAQYRVQVIGRLPTVRERFYAITVERRLKHPAVVAISKAARQDLFD